MLKHFKLFLILITLLYLPLQSIGQNPQIAITPTQTLQNAQVLYFSNFDIFNVGNAQYLFDVRINNVDLGAPGNENARLILKLYLDDPSNPIASATSDLFPVVSSPGTQYNASNVQLINANLIGVFTNLNFSTTFDPPDTKFEDEFYGSGKARRGIYWLQAILRVSGYPDSETTVKLLIRNPSDIQLSTPGNKAGAGSPPETNDFPVFTFFSDGTEFILKVYEKLAHHKSVEDVINSGNPICEELLTVPVLDYATATTGQPLQIGHTYYWCVDVLVPTTAGNETFRSEVYQFKVTQGTGTNAEGTAVTSILEMLRPIVGNQVDDYSKILSNFELKNIRLNGKTITIYELHQIIDGYEGHLVEVLDLVLD